MPLQQGSISGLLRQGVNQPQQPQQPNSIVDLLRGTEAEDKPERGAISNFLRGLATGGGQSLTSLAGLPGLAIPGEDPFERFEERATAGVEKFFDPQGRAGAAGKLTGRIIGEGAQVLTGGAGIAKGLAKAGVPAVQKLRQAGRLQKTLGETLSFAPIDAALGAQRAKQQGRSPLGGAATEVAIGAIGGGLLNILTPLGRPSIRAAQTTAAAEKLLASSDDEIFKAITKKGAARVSEDVLSVAIRQAEKLSEAGFKGEAAKVLRKATGTVKGELSPTQIIDTLEEALSDLAMQPAKATALATAKGTKILDKVVGAIQAGELSSPETALRFLGQEAGGDPALGAILLGNAVRVGGSQSGKVLNRLNLLKKWARRFSREELRRVGMESLYVEPTVFSRVGQAGGDFIDVWRASITAQLATAQRNLFVGLIRNPMEVFENTMTGAVQAMRGDVGWKVTAKGGMKGFTAMYGALSKKGRASFAQVLHQFPEEWHRFHGSMMFDMATGQGIRRSKGDPRMVSRYIDFLQTFNRAQEMPMRWMAFAGRFAARMTESGIDPASIAKNGIKSFTSAQQGTIMRAVKESTVHALDVTFATGIRESGVVGKGILRAYSRFPPWVFVHPFPRFLAASTRYLYERTPLSLVKFLRPEFRKGLAKGGRAENLQLVKWTEGLTLMGAGMALRASDLAGPKWYQVRVGTDKKGNPRYGDLRPFAPLSTFAFLGELIRGWFGEEVDLDGSDWFEAFLGIRRLTGTAIYLLDSWAGVKTMDEFIATTNNFVRAIVGGISIPVRTLKDLLSQFDEDEGMFRDVREGAQLGPVKAPNIFSEFIANVPVLGTATLPVRPSPTRTEEAQPRLIGDKVAPGVVRQLTGFSVTSQTPLEAEARRLNLRPRTFTGVEALDRATDEILGQMIENSGLDEFVASDQFKSMEDDRRKIFLQNAMRRLRITAKKAALPSVANEVIETMIRRLEGEKPSTQREKVDNLEIPRALKAVILIRLQGRRRRRESAPQG